jgi:NTE family protein
MEKHKTIGLALGSGGFRGFAHIGVIRSLEKHGIPINYLSGTSIGAWVAASYAIFKDSDKLEKDLTDKPRENWSILLDFSWTGGLIGGRKVSKFLESSLHNHDFSTLKIPLKIVTTDLITGQPYIFESGDVALAVRASISVPLVFKPISHEDKLLVDGGLCNPVPSDLLRQMGADVVVGVNVYSKKEFIGNKLSMPHIALRSMRILLYNLAEESYKTSDVIINIDLSKYSEKSSLSKYFSKEIGDEIIKIGEQETDKFIPQIKALLE